MQGGQASAGKKRGNQKKKENSQGQGWRARKLGKTWYLGSNGMSLLLSRHLQATDLENFGATIWGWWMWLLRKFGSELHGYICLKSTGTGKHSSGMEPNVYLFSSYACICFCSCLLHPWNKILILRCCQTRNMNWNGIGRLSVHSYWSRAHTCNTINLPDRHLKPTTFTLPYRQN